MEPDAVEIRVLGCLIEKQRTTPDAYPLSLNALRLACNQSTNREPVVDYDEQTVVEALRRLALRGWTRLASGAGSRARKYRHLLDDAFGLDDAEVSLLAVLMLRGPQTPGELKQRGAAPARLRRSRRRARDARAPGRARPGRPPRAPAGPEGGPLRAAARGRHRWSRSPPTPERRDWTGEQSSRRPRRIPRSRQELTPAEDRLTRLEREVSELRTELAALRSALGD